MQIAQIWLVISYVAVFILGIVVGKSWGRQEYHDYLVEEQRKKEQIQTFQNHLKGGKSE